MASSDDEGEMVPKNVSDYEFISGNEESVSFSTLPIEWDKGGTHDGRNEQIFLSGKTDNGLLKIYKQVVAWKFDLPREKPEISVLSIDGYWIKLLKPRKPFLDIIRTIQITLYFLHFIRWNPQQSLKALWDYLNKTFSTFERKPSEDDLVDHMFLINEAVKGDETLANSKLLSTFLEEKPRKKTFNEDINSPFIVDDVNESEDQEEFLAIDDNGDNESDEDDCFDSVCAICDNGGHILICEGKCMRSFHATAEDGEESNCESLGFTDSELEAIKNIAFYCKNCEYKQHQCFVCGELGSSDESSGAQVFCCVNGACGHFYHPRCVAKLLHPEDNAAVAEHEKRIAAGEQFTCPAHKCHVCKELEVRSDDHLQFAICRRCPRAYHRKCLPREIAFEEDVDEEGEIIQRAWEDLIPNRVLIYCLEHEIDPDIATPVRDHIKFPGPQLNKKKKIPLESTKKKDQLKERGLTLEDDADKRIPAKPVDKVSYSSKQRKRFRKKVGKLSVQESSKKHKVARDGDKGEMSLGSRLYAAFYAMNFEPEKSSRVASVHGEPERTLKVNSTVNIQKDSLSLDADSQNRILNLMKDASSSITLDQVKERHKSPSTHAQNSKFYVDNITMGKVEGTVQAVRAALKKLDDGGNVLEAEAVCGKDLLIQVGKWKDKLKVYLAPFLYGMRYTSFGRHFTKLDKLKEIVDILHWYVRDGDMLVDFCCGSNDFSCLMKKKFDEMGGRCSFKNYDILQPKNDSCFERRDWMGVRPNELPDGSQLIMGLNPPFGVNAALANKFINKALEFKPKLLILIAPTETKRLDEKEYPYDLIWEDDQMFVGKSFYLPGCVDANDKQIEDWNVSAPALYLWSRPDWTPKHKAIAEQHGHFPGTQKQYGLGEKENHDVMHVHNSCQECHNIDESFVNRGKVVHLDKPENQEQNGRETMSHQEGLPHDSNGAEGDKSCTREQNHSEANPTKSGGKRKRRQSNSNLPEDKHSPSQVVYSGRDGHCQQSNQRSFSTYHPRSQTGYNGNQEVDGAIRARLYSWNGEEPRPGMSSRRARAPSPMLDFGLRAPSDRWMGWPKERGGNLPYRPYMGEVSVSYGREEPSPWNQRGGFRPRGPYPGAGFPSPRGPVNPAADPMYGGNGMHASATQRYASRLGVDEFNHSLVARPAMQDTSGIHRPAFQAGSLGFAAAPYRPYSRHNSSGWLNE